MHGVQEDVKMLETHSIAKHQPRLGKTGSMGLNGTMHYISPGQDYFLGNSFRQPIVRKLFPAD